MGFEQLVHFSTNTILILGPKKSTSNFVLLLISGVGSRHWTMYTPILGPDPMTSAGVDHVYHPSTALLAWDLDEIYRSDLYPDPESRESVSVWTCAVYADKG
jgi:hypothetical protein